MAKKRMNIEDDKRNYFRIDDVSLIRHKVVDAAEGDLADDYAYQKKRNRCTLRARLESMSREMQPVHKMIASKNSKVADYLSMLDRKLMMLADCLLDDDCDSSVGEPQAINLGAGGVSFMNGSPIMVGGMIEIELVLLPGNEVIFSRAKVVTCEKQDNESRDNKYRIAVEFTGMTDEVRDLISRHVIKKEIDNVVAGSEERGAVTR